MQKIHEDCLNLCEELQDRTFFEELILELNATCTALQQQLQPVHMPHVLLRENIPSSVSNSLMASMTFDLSVVKCCLKFSSLSPPEVRSLWRDSCWSVSSLLPRDLHISTKQTSSKKEGFLYKHISYFHCIMSSSETKSSLLLRACL